MDVAFTLGWFTGLRLAVARVLGQNACKQRPAVWLLKSLQVALVSGGVSCPFPVRWQTVEGWDGVGRQGGVPRKRSVREPSLNGTLAGELSHVP